jgi:hypothetical protein
VRLRRRQHAHATLAIDTEARDSILRRNDHRSRAFADRAALQSRERSRDRRIVQDVDQRARLLPLRVRIVRAVAVVLHRHAREVFR